MNIKNKKVIIIKNDDISDKKEEKKEGFKDSDINDNSKKQK